MTRVIFGVVLVNAIIGFAQESKAVKAIEALARMMTTEATVLRAGKRLRISSAELVPGDIVFLQSGDKTPADMRLFQTRELQIDESALTGESLPVDKSAGTIGHDAVLADRLNMAYASTLVTFGQGGGVVVATGDGAEVGRISQLISAAKEMETPLTRKMAGFSQVLLYVILALAAVTFAVGVMQGRPAVDMFMAAVALAVGAIPEGLPAAMTITLAIGVSRMARRKVIIRKLPAVETLGGANVICTDKTGTLTENQMTVLEIAAGGERFTVSGSGYSPEGEILGNGIHAHATSSAALYECLRAGLLCNDSGVIEGNGRWSAHGDPTEGALIVSARKGGLAAHDEHNRFRRMDTIPFEAQHQYMATLHDSGGGLRTVYIKGSVEVILEKCTSLLSANGENAPLDKERVLKDVEEMAAKGLRLIAFARGEAESGASGVHHDDVSSGLTFLGLQGMIDPPRAEAVEAVRKCHSAGIQVKMITGDHAITALAIARLIGLNTDGGTVTGMQMARMQDSELIEVAARTSVFARVTPEQKLRLVEALQARGNVVAMTGDGVNDAPALKRADIGVAMGAAGTEVAKEAADMVLMDDNFASIEAAVEEGRAVFDNLTKFIIWTLPTNLGEGLVILVAIFADVMLPILPVQILWINMTTAVFLGLMLAFEPKEPGLMLRRPRNPETPILTRELISRIFIVGTLALVGSFGLFEWELARDPNVTVAEARTVAVNVFVMTELFYLFNCRSLKNSMSQTGLFSNPWVIGGVLIMLFLQGLYTYLPAMNWMFRSAPISLEAWGRILAVSATVLVVVEIEKWLWRGSENLGVDMAGIHKTS
ncbi:MAG: cation-transporting P-type ATPase [Nitrospinae bacterium]|nr:cation-transporting P-type ATPase [Nitrospinota bacterium]